MYDTECPYCGCEINIVHDDGYGYEEDRNHEQQCGECDKYFIYNTSISFSYKTHKADCLNGGEHKFKQINYFPHKFTGINCSICGKIKTNDQSL